MTNTPRLCAACHTPALVIAKVYTDDARRVLCGKCCDNGSRFVATGLVMNGKGKILGRESLR